MSNHHQSASGPGDGHIETAAIGQEANFASGVGTDGAEHDDLLLTALITVHAAYFEPVEPSTLVEASTFVEEVGQQTNLSRVRRHDANVMTFEVACCEKVANDAERRRRLVAVGLLIGVARGVLWGPGRVSSRIGPGRLLGVPSPSGC